MNKEVKALWLEALRSGEYEQGIGALKRESEGITTHCCLGVLCELAVKAGVIAQGESGGSWGTFKFGGEDAILPTAVQEWADLTGSGYIKVDDTTYAPHLILMTDHAGAEYTALTEINDHSPWDNFATVARIIEEKF